MKLRGAVNDLEAKLAEIRERAEAGERAPYGGSVVDRSLAAAHRRKARKLVPLEQRSWRVYAISDGEYLKSGKSTAPEQRLAELLGITEHRER